MYSRWNENLSDENQKKADLLKDGITSDEWVFFRDEKTVQLDGDFELSDLKCLVAMMESFKSNTKEVDK